MEKAFVQFQITSSIAASKTEAHFPRNKFLLSQY